MKYFITGITLMFLFFANAELSADRLYTWTDEKGNLHITQQPPPNTARTDNVMTYQPQPEAQTQKIEKNAKSKEMKNQTAREKDTRPEAKKASTKTEQQDEEEVYIGREGKMIRRGEEVKETRDRRQDTRPVYRYHRR